MHLVHCIRRTGDNEIGTIAWGSGEMECAQLIGFIKEIVVAIKLQLQNRSSGYPHNCVDR